MGISQSDTRTKPMLQGQALFKKYKLGIQHFKSARDLPKRYPNWIKVNSYLPGVRPFQTLNIEVDENVIHYFEIQINDLPAIVNFEGYRPIAIEDLLRFNRFFELKDNDITLLGKYAMKKNFTLYKIKEFRKIYYNRANIIAYLLEGIVLDYAILHDASEEIVKAIQKLAKGMKYTDDFIFSDQWVPRNDMHIYPMIHYESGRYFNTYNYSLRELGLDELHVAKRRLSGKISK